MQVRSKIIIQALLLLMVLILAGCGLPNPQGSAIDGQKASSSMPPGDTNPDSASSQDSGTNQLQPTPFPDAVPETDLASVGNYAWEDLNANGLQDENEPGVEGVSVNLLSNQGDLLQSTQTDVHGYFNFVDLAAGEYALEFSYPNTFFSPQNAGSDLGKDSDAAADGKTAVFRLGTGEQRADVDAGLLYPGHAAVCPLTGLPTDADLLDNRPIFISISHFPAWATRPSTGLNSAPVVFETLIDEGQTRLQALFYCGYPKNNSSSDVTAQDSGFDIRGVRSGRIFYSELAKLFSAGLIFGGASAEVYREIAPYQCGVVDNQGIPKNIGGAGLDIDSLQAIAEKCKQPLGNTQLDVWQFGPPPSGGEKADNFLMVYNYLNQTRWEFSPEAGGYLRYQNDPETPDEFTLSTDKLTGQAIVRQNILLLEVPHQVLNRAGTIIDFDLTNERGFAWLLRDGAIYKICWSAIFKDYATSSNRYRPPLLYDCSSKEPVNLAYGSMWINVVDPSFWLEQKGETLTATQPFLGYGP
jgi:hypothetical protein